MFAGECTFLTQSYRRNHRSLRTLNLITRRAPLRISIYRDGRQNTMGFTLLSPPSIFFFFLISYRKRRVYARFGLNYSGSKVGMQPRLRFGEGVGRVRGCLAPPPLKGTSEVPWNFF